MSLEIIPNIFFKNSLLKHAIFSNLRNDIIAKLKEKIPEINNLRLNQELTEAVCLLVENLSPDKNSLTNQPIDKKALVIDILTSIFSLSPAEQETVKQQVQYSFDNGLIIKIPTIRKHISYIKEYIKRKFL